MQGAALISDDGRFRYWLARVWEPGLEPMVWIMLNPSTADADTDDATIRRCCGFAKRAGHGGILVVNLFAYRSTDPRELVRLGAGECVGQQNDSHIVTAAKATLDRGVVCAWGSLRRELRPRASRVLELLQSCAATPMCYGRTAAGEPRHPVRLAYETPLVLL